MKNKILLLVAIALQLLSKYTFAQNIPATPPLNEIIDLIKEKYQEDVNIDSIVLNMVNDYLNQPETINKLLVSLDPHSYYFTAEEYKYFKEDLGGTFSGVGLSFRIFNDTVVIVNIIDNGPAQKAGINTGDRILAIDGKTLSGQNKSMDDIFSALRGEKNTGVDITIRDGHTGNIKEYKIIRDQIIIKSIDTYYMLDEKTGYIRLNGFIENGFDEFSKALAELNKSGMKNLILDLRSNYGGYFQVARKIADEFLSENKLIVYTEGYNSPRSDYFATSTGQFEKGGLVVLVNGETASSAEILTGALQDQKRATIIGTRTYGKGLIQQMFTLSDTLTALKLTTAKYYTPNGRCIQRSYNSGPETYFNDYEMAAINSPHVSDEFRDDEWGIHPDIFIAEDTTSSDIILNAFIDRFYIQDIAFEYFAGHINEFSAYQHPEDLIKNFNFSGHLPEDINAHIKVEENALPEEEKIIYSEKDLEIMKEKIEHLFKAYLAYEIWGAEGLYRVKNFNDPDISAAMHVLKNK